MAGHPDRRDNSRLRPAVHAFVLLATALALAVLVTFLWTGVAHPQAGARLFFGEETVAARLAIRRLTAWLVVGACGVVSVSGVVLLALDMRARAKPQGGASARGRGAG